MEGRMIIENKDCCVMMREMIGNNQKVDLVVTSPPYDNLRSYKGLCEWNWEVFCEISELLYNVVDEGGVVVWVVGDATVKGSETGTSFKQALYFKEIGFNLHDTMIFQKANPIPQNHNRYEQTFEYIFIFSKGKPKTFNPIRIPTKMGGKPIDWGKRKTKMDNNQCRRHRDSETLITKEDKIHGNIFTYSVGGKSTGHPAVFPLQLALDQIISWSNEGDTVFDPFMGSGTTGIAALQNNRHFIGCEIVPEYFEIAKNQIKLIKI